MTCHALHIIATNCTVIQCHQVGVCIHTTQHKSGMNKYILKHHKCILGASTRVFRHRRHMFESSQNKSTTRVCVSDCGYRYNVFCKRRKDNNLHNIPAQLLSHLIIQLNILLPETSHGALTGTMMEETQRFTAAEKKDEEKDINPIHTGGD